MTANDVIEALSLPGAALVDRRVPKSLLLEHGAPTAADKRRINDGVERIQWVAALKPTTIGIATFRDDTREYLEISVLHLTLRTGAKLTRLVELVHRAVPYPVLAAAEQGDRLNLSVAHKRWSQGEAGKTVLDSETVAVDGEEADPALEAAFLGALALDKQPRRTLRSLYQGWMDTLLAFQAAKRSGTFVLPGSAEAASARRDALQECERLEAEIARLRAAATREKQMSRQVEFNLELKRLEAARTAALERL